MTARTRLLSIRNMARVGLISRGAVYFLMGVLALMVALETPGGRTTDTRGALRTLLHEPLGYILLTMIALGLFCYAVWRLLEGIYDYDGYGRGAGGLCMRLGQIVGSMVHFALGAYSLNLIFLFMRTSDHRGEQKLVRWLFGWPFGDWLVGAVGLVVILFGVAQMYIAWCEAFRFYIEIPKRRSGLILLLCKYGLVARGILLVLVGWFFFNAARKHSPREAGGFKEAWQALLNQPFGHVLLGIVAMGFIAYAFFSAVEAAYRKH